MSLTREVPLEKGKAALLIIDVQNYCAKPGQGLLKDEESQKKDKPLIDRVYNTVIPSLQNTLKACRANRGSIEVIYTYIESLTLDGRDQSLDYKITPLFVPKGHPDGKILEEIAPEGDEILIPKTACSVFNSTNIEYVLRNLGNSSICACTQINCSLSSLYVIITCVSDFKQLWHYQKSF